MTSSHLGETVAGTRFTLLGEPADGALFTPLDAELESTFQDWLNDYVCQPHPELGRDGPVCPFVRPSLRAECLVAVSHAWRGSADPAAMAAVAHDAIALFKRIDWNSRNSTLHALALVMTGLPDHSWWLVEAGQRLVKGAAVEQGIMVGEFHPQCESPANRNPSFPANRAPFPMFVIRNMALHDIVFLHDDPRWFEQYRRRYGHNYSHGAHGTKKDPHYDKLYHWAAQRWAQSINGQPGERSPDTPQPPRDPDQVGWWFGNKGHRGDP